MSLLRPLDPSFPIDHQLAVDASPVVLVNIFTFTNPEFQSKLSRYPASAVATPHLFQKIAVPGVCVA